MGGAWEWDGKWELSIKNHDSRHDYGSTIYVYLIHRKIERGELIMDTKGEGETLSNVKLMSCPPESVSGPINCLAHPKPEDEILIGHIAIRTESEFEIGNN
jgi:hypothetical protein